MMKIKSFLYYSFARFYGIDLWYLYQMFATGDVIDYRDHPDKKQGFVTDLKVLFYNIKYRSVPGQKFLLELLAAPKEERKLLKFKRREALRKDDDLDSLDITDFW